MESTTEHPPPSGGGWEQGKCLCLMKDHKQRAMKTNNRISIISTDHCNQIKGHFCVLMSFLNISINKKLIFFSEVVRFKKCIVSQPTSFGSRGSQDQFIPTSIYKERTSKGSLLVFCSQGKTLLREPSGPKMRPLDVKKPPDRNRSEGFLLFTVLTH